MAGTSDVLRSTERIVLIWQLLTSAPAEIQRYGLCRLLELSDSPRSSLHNAKELLRNELACHQILRLGYLLPERDRAAHSRGGGSTNGGSRGGHHHAHGGYPY